MVTLVSFLNEKKFGKVILSGDYFIFEEECLWIINSF
jgi:hypothetical protein